MQACIHDGCIYRVARQEREGGGNGSDGAPRRATPRHAAPVGYASPLEGNKGGATREIKGAPNGRRVPRLRHVFLDNLFGNINHREHRETQALVERVCRRRRGKRYRLSRSLLFFANVSCAYHVRTREKRK